MAFRADGCAFPSAFDFVYVYRFLYVSFSVYLVRRVFFYRGGRTCFPAVLKYFLEDLRGKVNGFIAYVAVVFYFVYSRGGSSGFDVVSHFGGCGFPAGRTIDEIDDLHHTDRNTPSGLHAAPLLFLFEKGKGQGQGYLRSLGLSSYWAPRWELIVLKVQGLRCGSTRPQALVEQLQGSRCGSTRPQAFNEAASRSPAVVDSPGALAFMRRMCARGLTTHRLSTPRNAKEIGRTVRDSFCTGAQEVGLCGWCGACEWSTPWGWEAADLPRVTLAAPQPQNNHKTHEEELDSRTAPHPCAVHVQVQVQPHDVTQQLHSARPERARTSEARVTSHAVHTSLFSRVFRSLCPLSSSGRSSLRRLARHAYHDHARCAVDLSLCVERGSRRVLGVRGRFLAACIGGGFTCWWFGRSGYPRGVSLGGGIPLASSGATSCGTSSSTYGHGVPLLALEWPGVSVGGVPKTDHASLVHEKGGNPRTDLAFSLEMGGDPRTDHASFGDGALSGVGIAATYSPYRQVELASQTAKSYPLSTVCPDPAVSHDENQEHPDGFLSTAEDLDELPNSAEMKGFEHSQGRNLDSTPDCESTAYTCVSRVAEKSEEVRQSDFGVQNLPASVSSSELIHWRARFDSAICYKARWIQHIGMGPPVCQKVQKVLL